MGDGEANLTGEWTGIYSYPAHYPPNTFEASIRDAEGGVSPGRGFGDSSLSARSADRTQNPLSYTAPA